jgi:DNA/RNA endonuclease YhcR with UshA esterase domain
MLLPRRTFRRISQRLLHDRTADHIAETVGRLPHVVATIVAFDTTLPRQATERIVARQHTAALEPALPTLSAPPSVTSNGHRASPDGTVTIGSLSWKQRVTVEGRIKLVQASTAAGKSLEVQLFDETGGIHLLFFGRTRIPGLVPGATLRATGMVGEYKGHLALANPRYEIMRIGM